MDNGRVSWLNLVSLLGFVAFAFLAPSCRAPEERAIPESLNENYLDPELDVGRMVDRFEGESREVYRERETIADAMRIEPRQRLLGHPIIAAVVGQGRVPVVVDRGLAPDLRPAVEVQNLVHQWADVDLAHLRCRQLGQP